MELSVQEKPAGQAVQDLGDKRADLRGLSKRILSSVAGCFGSGTGWTLVASSARGTRSARIEVPSFRAGQVGLSSDTS